MRIHASCVAFTFVLASLPAQDFLQISIGVRETVAAGGTVTTIGANSGTVTGSGIEWIDRDAQTLVLDGTWQTFTFDLGNANTNATVLAFAGTTANSILEGTHGTIENIRILNSGAIAAPITLLIDDVVDTTTTLGAVTVCDFDDPLYGTGVEAMFQEPSYSGSTTTNVMAGGTSLVQDTFPHASRTSQIDFQFATGVATEWLRLTTHNVVNVGNPIVQFDDNSVITFKMMGYTGMQTNLGSGGPGMLTSAFVGSGLNAGQASTLYVGNAPASTLGGILVSFPGFPDLPVLGGNVVSGSGNFMSIPFFADAGGVARLPITGNSALLDLVLQSAMIDMSLPQKIAFSEAYTAAFGQ